MLALLVALQIAATDEQLFDAVKQTKLNWGTCIEVYATAAVMTDRNIVPSEAAGAALGHCLPQEQAFRGSADNYLHHHGTQVDEVMNSERQRLREIAMAAVVDYRMKHFHDEPKK